MGDERKTEPDIPPGRRWTDEALWREFRRLSQVEGDVSTLQHAVFGYPDDTKTGLLRRVGATEDDVAALDTKLFAGLAALREAHIEISGEVASGRRTTKLIGGIVLVAIPTITTVALHFLPPG